MIRPLESQGFYRRNFIPNIVGTVWDSGGQNPLGSSLGMGIRHGIHQKRKNVTRRGTGEKFEKNRVK